MRLTPSCLILAPLVVDPAATIQYVISGKADIAGSDWYRTAERAKVLGLSYPTYLDQMGIYSKDGISTVAGMMGKQVGTVSGFLWVTDLQKLLGANLHPYPNPVALAQDLGVGRIQVGVDSYGTAPARRSGAATRASSRWPNPTRGSGLGGGGAGQPALHQGQRLPRRRARRRHQAMHADGSIAKALSSFGLDPSGAETGRRAWCSRGM